MKRKATVEMTCIATVWVNEDVQGNIEIEDIEDIREILDYEEK